MATIDLTTVSDGELLGIFVELRQDEAFAELMRRHGPMVLDVCRSSLGDGPDAEDAAQAVFLALLNKAAAVRHHPTLAGWLHRVAWYAASCEKRSTRVRMKHEREAADMRRDSMQTGTDNVSRDLIHTALSNLPEKYRLPIILHHLEGRSQEEVADMLGINAGTISSNLTRGRQMLRDRLKKTGAVISAAVLAMLLADRASAGVSSEFVNSTTRMAAHMLNAAAAASAASAKVISISKGALQMLFMEKIKFAAMTTLAILLVGGTAAGAYVAIAGGTKGEAAKQASAKSLDQGRSPGIGAAEPSGPKSNVNIAKIPTPAPANDVPEPARPQPNVVAVPIPVPPIDVPEPPKPVKTEPNPNVDIAIAPTTTPSTDVVESPKPQPNVDVAVVPTTVTTVHSQPNQTSVQDTIFILSSVATNPAAQPANPLPATQPTKELTLDLGNNVTMKLVLIPAGKFMMGSTKEEKASFDTRPQHEVTISRAFYMGVYEVTRGQFSQFISGSGYKTEPEKVGWSAFTVNNFRIVEPSLKDHFDKQYKGLSWKKTGFTQTDDHPVVFITHKDAVEFCKWLSKKTAMAVKLPTEAQWEYACRGGTTTAYHWGDDPEGAKGWVNINDLTRENYYKKIYGEKGVAPPECKVPWEDGFAFTSPVGQFKANNFGLYDMIGNVWEYCSDWYDKDYYAKSPKTDPQGPTDPLPLKRDPHPDGPWHIMRGGSFNYCNLMQGLRSAARCHDGIDMWPHTGFRVIVDLESTGSLHSVPASDVAVPAKPEPTTGITK